MLDSAEFTGIVVLSVAESDRSVSSILLAFITMSDDVPLWFPVISRKCSTKCFAEKQELLKVAESSFLVSSLLQKLVVLFSMALKTCALSRILKLC